ncbi:MAG: hypothetical protein ACPGR7_05880 [Flavobacteriaceae bacterium]
MKIFKLYFSLVFLLASINLKAQMQEEIKKSFYLSLDTRFDYTYQTFESNVAAKKSLERFEFSDFILETGMHFSEQISMVFRYVPYDGKRDVDGLSDNFQYAYINLESKNKHWNLSLGKFFMQVGTAEQFYDPNDVFNYSIVSNNLGVFKTGVSLTYRTESKQLFSFQVVNSSVEEDSFRQKFEYNINYYGYLLEGKIAPLVSFTSIPEIGAYSVNAGIMWNFHPLHVDTDYAMAYKMPNFYDGIYYQSLPIRVSWNGRHFRPFVKYIANSMKSDSDSTQIIVDGNPIELSTYNYRVWEGGLQYYPIPNKNLRFHIAASYSDDYSIDVLVPELDPINTRGHYTADFQIYVGVRIGVNFLKGIKSIQ